LRLEAEISIPQEPANRGSTITPSAAAAARPGTPKTEFPHGRAYLQFRPDQESHRLASPLGIGVDAIRQL